MGEMFFAVVAAFLIFIVLMPAFGVVAGIFFRVALPYAAGFWVCFVAVWLVSGKPVNWIAVLTLSAIWMLAVWFGRRKCQEQKEVRFNWYEGHYAGAWGCLTCFAPFRKGMQSGVVTKLDECQAEG